MPVFDVALHDIAFELGFDYASGDENPGDGDGETFDQLFPTGHTYFGFIEQSGPDEHIDFGYVTFELTI